MNFPPNLILPLVHLNGTAKDDLVQQLDDVYDALKKAEAALQKAGPHARDYYPLPDEDGKPAFNMAMRQHRLRLIRLANITNEIEVMAHGIGEKERFVQPEVIDERLAND